MQQVTTLTVINSYLILYINFSLKASSLPQCIFSNIAVLLVRVSNKIPVRNLSHVIRFWGCQGRWRSENSCWGFTRCTIVSFTKVLEKDVTSIVRIEELNPCRCLIWYTPTVLRTVAARILSSVFRSSNFIVSYEDETDKETDKETFICYRTYNLDCPRDVWFIHSRGKNKHVSEHNTQERFQEVQPTLKPIRLLHLDFFLYTFNIVLCGFFFFFVLMV